MDKPPHFYRNTALLSRPAGDPDFHFRSHLFRKAGFAMTTIRRNERSWAIELISKINAIAQTNDLAIKRAGGESTISTGRGSTMFPDVILYGDRAQTVILQGWELKMPDVPIEDEIFIRDAQRKAEALHLNSCLIWNFTYAVLYVRVDSGAFTKLRQWSDTSFIHTRDDVTTYRPQWEQLLETIVLELNGYFLSGMLHKAALGDVISQSAVTTVIQRNKELLAEALQSAAVRSATLEAYISQWWADIHSEYEHDETNPYKAYAKTVLLNWTNRILFAHLIKRRQNAALQVHEIGAQTTPAQANAIFQSITAACGFRHIFSPIPYNDILPDAAWQDLVELSLFLTENGMEHLEQEALQNILEGSVAIGKREINGQFTTPAPLARLLVRLTVQDWSEPVLDCCCGTGTIAQAALREKKGRFSAKEAAESVWACDKYSYPLQVASLSMTDADTVSQANRLFQHNALTLFVGEAIEIVDPETGHPVPVALPAFGAVTSNLPFVPFEIIPGDDKAEIAALPFAQQLDGRSDLYCYIALKIADVLKPGGTLGIITSNSWLGTKAGGKLLLALKDKYHLRQVHISGRGRWFQNADVVATILVLEKKADDQTKDTCFWLWKKSLEELASDPEAETALVNAALLERTPAPALAKQSRYSPAQMQQITGLNLSCNALFHSVEWLPDLQDKLIPISRAFRVFRGSRRGWDALFYPKAGEHAIEAPYLKKVLLNARNVTTLSASADRDAFCCGVSLEELRDLGHTGALTWIGKFADQKNGVGKPLPQVLCRRGMKWYELQDHEVAEIFTMMNPDQRLFFARFDTPSFVNQRLIGLTHTQDFPDLELGHALLNSLVTMFYIEAAGFGRGLGVLDINKDSISKCCMLNPKLVTQGDREKILAAFEPLKQKTIRKTPDELQDPIRLAFEREVFRSFGIEEFFDPIRSSLLSMQQTRLAVKET